MSEEIVDMSEFLRGLDLAEQRVRQLATAAIDIFGEQVIGDAQELAPVDTGDLKSSGTTLPAEDDGAKIEKQVGFGVDYAAAVHENLTADFNLEKNPLATAKFLEKSLRNLTGKFGPFVGGHIRGGIGQ